jgi:predicted nucleic acid-binding protein
VLLVDTSVWVDHFRRTNKRLSKLLVEAEVLTHQFVVGELACGNLKNRGQILGLLRELPSAQLATHEETLTLLEKRKLMGKGIGWIDAHLLASALLSDAQLWTYDKRLNTGAAEIGVEFHGI